MPMNGPENGQVNYFCEFFGRPNPDCGTVTSTGAGKYTIPIGYILRVSIRYPGKLNGCKC